MEKEEGGGTESEQDTRSKSSLFCISQLCIRFYAMFIGQFNFLRLLISRALFRGDLTRAHPSLPVNSFVKFPILDLALPSTLCVDCILSVRCPDEYLGCSR